VAHRDKAIELVCTSNTEKQRAYRRRLADKGWREFIASLPSEMLAFVDELKERQGLPNRSLVLLDLIEEKRRSTVLQ
jgi:hypothetical protein